MVVTYNYSSASNLPVLYLDGQDLTSVSVYKSPSGSVDADPGALFLGNKDSLSGTFDGTLDDVRIYDRELTAAEVSDLHSGN